MWDQYSLQFIVAFGCCFCFALTFLNFIINLAFDYDYANSTIIACLKVNHYYFYTIFPYIKATSSFSDTQPQKWQSSTLQEKQAALTFLRQCSVSKKTTCAYCVVCLNNFQEYFVLTLTLILETKPCIKVVPCIFLWILCSNLQGVVINFIVNSILR